MGTIESRCQSKAGRELFIFPEKTACHPDSDLKSMGCIRSPLAFTWVSWRGKTPGTSSPRMLLVKRHGVRYRATRDLEVLIDHTCLSGVSKMWILFFIPQHLDLFERMHVPHKRKEGR